MRVAPQSHSCFGSAPRLLPPDTAKTQRQLHHQGFTPAFLLLLQPLASGAYLPPWLHAGAWHRDSAVAPVPGWRFRLPASLPGLQGHFPPSLSPALPHPPLLLLPACAGHPTIPGECSKGGVHQRMGYLCPLPRVPHAADARAGTAQGQGLRHLCDVLQSRQVCSACLCRGFRMCVEGEGGGAERRTRPDAG